MIAGILWNCSVLGWNDFFNLYYWRSWYHPGTHISSFESCSNCSSLLPLALFPPLRCVRNPNWSKDAINYCLFWWLPGLIDYHIKRALTVAPCLALLRNWSSSSYSFWTKLGFRGWWLSCSWLVSRVKLTLGSLLVWWLTTCRGRASVLTSHTYNIIFQFWNFEGKEGNQTKVTLES